MNFTPKDIQAEFLKLIDNNKEYCYISWKEIPKTKVWYNESDNTFHTDLNINIVFEGYAINEIDNCLDDLVDKIIKTMEKRGIILHAVHPFDAYEATIKKEEMS